jgi:glycosyltransferase involved in cell wall biosynthesis
MRVLQIANNLSPGGAERLLLEMIPLFNARGVTMDLLILNGTRYPYLEALRSARCCNVYSLGENVSLRNPLLIWKIRRYLRQYDVAHVHLFPSLYWAAIAKMISFSRTKMVYTEHSTSNRRMRQAWLGAVQTIIYKQYDRIICITREVLAALQRHTKMDGTTFVVIGNGVNLEKIREARALPRSDFFDGDVKILLQVSSFQEPKDQATLIRALALLPHNVKLLLVGEGVLKSRCEALVQELGLGDRVRFLGLRMDVPQLLKTSDIVILSSKFEGLSLFSIEGMASGRPFIASDVPGLTEMVSGAGVLVPSQNEQALASAVERLLNDSTYYAAVTNACVAHAQDFDIETMVTKYVELYAALLRE